MSGRDSDDVSINSGAESDELAFNVSTSFPGVSVKQSSTRRYTFKVRRRGQAVQRFEKSKRVGIVTSVEDLKAIITANVCTCWCKCFEQFLQPLVLGRVFESRNTLHGITNQADRRVYLSKIICSRPWATTQAYTLVGMPSCVKLILATLHISRNLFYAVKARMDFGVPMSTVLAGPHRYGISKEEVVCGWLFELAASHDPQPDKNYTILAHKRKRHVFQEYMEDVVKGKVPEVSYSTFVRVWRHNVGSRIVVRKCMRFALCDTCSDIQRRREITSDRSTLKLLNVQEREHMRLYKAERHAYATRIAEALSSDGDVGSLACDGADQGAYGLPYYCQV
jgi:hypothetical protein